MKFLFHKRNAKLENQMRFSCKYEATLYQISLLYS